MQVILHSSMNPLPLRQLTSSEISHLVRVPGIVVSASRLRAKATRRPGDQDFLEAFGHFGLLLP